MRRPALSLALTATVIGSIGPIVRQVDLPAVAIVACRVWVAVVVLGVTLATGRIAGPPVFSVARGRGVVVGAVLALHWVALFAAYQRAPVAWVVLVVYFAPVLTAGLGVRALGERVDRPTGIALAVALAGFVLLARPQARGTGPAVTGSGLALALVAMVLFVALIVAGKPLSTRYGGIRAAFVQLVVAGVLLAPVAAVQRWGPPRAAWLWLVVLGAVHTGAALSVLAAVLARLPVARFGVLMYLEPVSAVLCAWVFLGERPGGATALGGVLVVAAGLAVVAREGRTAAPSLQSPP